MFFSISLVMAVMLLSSSNAISSSFAQTNATSNEDQTTATSTDNSNTDRQNYDEFQNCLENEAGTSGFATEDQIRDCFAPIYIEGSSSDNDSDSDSSSSSDSDSSSSSDSDSSSSSDSDSN